METMQVLAGSAREHISDMHARGLRRDFFFWMKYRNGTNLIRFVRRMQTVNMPYPSFRDRKAVFLRTRELLRRCSDYYTEMQEDKEATCFGVVVLPMDRPHEDGRAEPVLNALLFTLTLAGGKVAMECTPCGRISHHAIERMYQRLRTSSHMEVFDELRSALWWVPALHGMASMTRRSVVLRQLPLPTPSGVLRCIRDEAVGLLEVRTFTLNGTSPRIDRSLAGLRHWGNVPREERKGEFHALLRHPDNRWWRETYRPGS